MMKKLLFLTVLLAFGLTSFSQADGDYESAQTGVWGVETTWNIMVDGTFVPIDGQGAPTVNNNVWIRSPHTVSGLLAIINYNGTVTIDAGGTLDIEPQILGILTINNVWTINGTYDNEGVIVFSPLTVSGTGKINVGTTGTMIHEGDVTVQDGGTFNNNGSVVLLPESTKKTVMN